MSVAVSLWRGDAPLLGRPPVLVDRSSWRWQAIEEVAERTLRERGADF